MNTPSYQGTTMPDLYRNMSAVYDGLFSTDCMESWYNAAPRAFRVALTSATNPDEFHTRTKAIASYNRWADLLRDTPANVAMQIPEEVQPGRRALARPNVNRAEAAAKHKLRIDSE